MMRGGKGGVGANLTNHKKRDSGGWEQRINSAVPLGRQIPLRGARLAERQTEVKKKKELLKPEKPEEGLFGRRGR